MELFSPLFFKIIQNNSCLLRKLLYICTIKLQNNDTMKTLYERLKPEYKELLDNHKTWLALKEEALKGLQKSYWIDLTYNEIGSLENVTKKFDYNFLSNLFL